MTYALLFGCFAAIASAVIGGPFVSFLRGRNIGKAISTDGPESHLSKAGTPTLGGLLTLVVPYGTGDVVAISISKGQTLWTEFFQNKDWPVASAVAIALLAILLAPILIYQHLQMRALEDR